LHISQIALDDYENAKLIDDPNMAFVNHKSDCIMYFLPMAIYIIVQGQLVRKTTVWVI